MGGRGDRNGDGCYLISNVSLIVSLDGGEQLENNKRTVYKTI